MGLGPTSLALDECDNGTHNGIKMTGTHWSQRSEKQTQWRKRGRGRNEWDTHGPKGRRQEEAIVYQPQPLPVLEFSETSQSLSDSLSYLGLRLP